MNEFEILGVTTKSTKAEVKKAYKRLAQIHHPDKSLDNGEKFKEIKAAYDLIIKEWNVKKPRPTPKAPEPEPEPEPTWTWKDFTKKPADTVFHKVNVNFSELFGSRVQIPNTIYYVNVPYGIVDGTKQFRVLCKSLNGQHAEYFNIEYQLYDPTGFYSLKMIDGHNCLYCKINVTTGMVLGEYEISIRNIHPDLPSLLIKASTNRLRIPHVGLPGLGGSRGNLYVDQVVELKPLEEEIYPVLQTLHKKLNNMMQEKTFKQHIK
jgi:DnaJ-class molecular chaperone